MASSINVLLVLLTALYCGVMVQGVRLPLRTQVTTTKSKPDSLIDQVNHKAMCYSPIIEYYGARAKMSVHELALTTGHSSMASIRVLNHDNGKLNMLAAGWQVNPDFYGDPKTRLFTYWTVDDQQQTGCYDRECNGFVLEDASPLVPGSILSSKSSVGGRKKYITLTIFRDPTTENWVLSYEDEVQSFDVGHWPGSLFNNGLAYNATQILYGGSVSYPANNPGSSMGSGHFASEGEHKAASFKNLEYLDKYKNAYRYEDLSVKVDFPKCYDLDLTGDSGDGDGVRFYYGGPAGCTK